MRSMMQRLKLNFHMMQRLHDRWCNVFWISISTKRVKSAAKCGACYWAYCWGSKRKGSNCSETKRSPAPSWVCYICISRVRSMMQRLKLVEIFEVYMYRWSPLQWMSVAVHWRIVFNDAFHYFFCCGSCTHMW